MWDCKGATFSTTTLHSTTWCNSIEKLFFLVINGDCNLTCCSWFAFAELDITEQKVFIFLGIKRESSNIRCKAQTTRVIQMKFSRVLIVIMELPRKESHPPLADHYDLCLKCLHGLVRRLQQNPAVLQEYDLTIKGQLQRGIVEPVQETPDSICRVHYLPHHAFVRHDKETTKVRVVYDASARTGGPSLNNCLHAGPKFNQRIMDILMRFRVRWVAVIADIEKAFHMISVAMKDRNVLRELQFLFKIGFHHSQGCEILPPPPQQDSSRSYRYNSRPPCQG